MGSRCSVANLNPRYQPTHLKGDMAQKATVILAMMVLLHSPCDGARRSRVEFEGAMGAKDGATLNDESNSEEFMHSQANVSVVLSKGPTVTEEKAPGDKCDCSKGSRPDSCCQSSTYKMT